MENVPIRSFSRPYSSAFRLNKERYSVSLRIQSECGKIQTRKTPNTDTFLAVFHRIAKTTWQCDTSEVKVSLVSIKFGSKQVLTSYRSMYPEVPCKKGVLKNFIKFTRKHLRQSLSFAKITDFRHATPLKRHSDEDVSRWILQIFKKTFFYRTPAVATSFADIYLNYGNKNSNEKKDEYIKKEIFKISLQ